ncbi:hypothetical protein HHI36_021586 [Cryptolaemus montrouzieri]|uniref:MADF domain-containing protein n=1 Tax=Cryptolaemus montrouzieri TaxID=559131 RepID=A0ABD2MY02_9CUCU
MDDRFGARMTETENEVTIPSLSLTERIIERVKHNDYLYDPKNANYRNQKRREAFWKELGSDLKLEGNEVRKKWKYLKVSYAKYLKSFSSNSNQKRNYQKWQWAKHLEFIRPHLLHMTDECLNEALLFEYDILRLSFSVDIVQYWFSWCGKDQFDARMVEPEIDITIPALSLTERIIERVKHNEYLYDPKNANYRNQKRREAFWRELGLDLNLEGNEVRKKWRNLKDSYAKYLKSFSSNPNQKRNYQKWHWAKHLEFMRPHLLHMVDDCFNEGTLVYYNYLKIIYKDIKEM